MEDQRLMLRLHSCREALAVVGDMLNSLNSSDRVAQQLQQLENLMSAIDAALITEAYMQRIEFAANQLFNELARLFVQRQAGTWDDTSRH